MQVPARIRVSMEEQQAHWAAWEMPINKGRVWNNVGSAGDRHSAHKHEASECSGKAPVSPKPNEGGST